MDRKHKTVTEIELTDKIDSFYYQEDLTKKLDAFRGDFDQHVLNEIVLWKVNRYAEFDKETMELINQIAASSEVLDVELTKKVVSKLLDTLGVGLPMASTILRFRNPKVYQIIDQRVYRIIYDHELCLAPAKKDGNHDSQVNLYLKYLSDLRAVCEKYSLNFHESDRILYLADKRVNKNFPLKHYSGKREQVND